MKPQTSNPLYKRANDLRLGAPNEDVEPRVSVLLVVGVVSKDLKSLLEQVTPESPLIPPGFLSWSAVLPMVPLAPTRTVG